MNVSFERRRSWSVLLVTVCLIPVLLYGVSGALKTTGNDVRQWLPQGFPETRRYDWFVGHFQSDEILLVSWPGATLDDPRLDRLAQSLVPPRWADSERAGEASADSTGLFRQAITAREILDYLTAEPMNLSREEAIRRLQGSLIGPDGQTTGVLVVVSKEGSQDRHAAVEAIYRTAQRETGLGPDELRLGGPTIDSVALDAESEQSRSTLGLAAVVLSLLLAWRCLRQVRLVAVVFATALFSAGMATAVLYYGGGQLSVVLVMMPILIYVLAVSGSIHLVHYYQEEVAERGPAGAARRAVAAAWIPCTLAGVTTAVGMASLAVSEIAPVRLFGIYSAAGLLCTLPALLVLLPAILEVWPAKAEPRESVSGKTGLIEASRSSWTTRLAAVVIRRHGWIVAGCVVLMLAVGIGLARLETSLKVLKLFAPEAKIVRDYEWLERNVGPLVPVEVVVQFERGAAMPLLDRLELVTEIQGSIEGTEGVGGAMSPATFFPAVPQGGGLRATTRRAVLERRLADAAADARLASYLRETDDGQLWRISARVAALNTLDYDRFVVELGEQIDPIVAGLPVRLTYTGAMPVIYKAQRKMLADLAVSFLSAFVLIGLIMIAVLRRTSAGMISMLPNIFPAVLMFGGMGWAGLACDIGSMMTASIAMGIAVDDTIHFLTWFRGGIRQGLSRREAIELACRKCAGAMVQTTLVCGLGLLPLSFSGFVPMARFAWLMIALLGGALLGDLLLMPAILAGPLGRFFAERPAPAWRRAVAAACARLSNRFGLDAEEYGTASM